MTPMAQMAEIIAITGDIGAGKSTVARMMESYGGIRFDADKMGHDLWLRSDIREAAVARWGTEILRDPNRSDANDPDNSHNNGNDNSNSSVNFATIAKRMFSSRIEYNWACHLMHPLVMAQLARAVAFLSPDQWAVAEIPLLFEVGRPNWANFVVYVTAPHDIRLERCRKRGWDEAELARRESFYLPAEDRKRYSDFVLPNNGNLDDLKQKVRVVLKNVLHYSSEWLCWLFEAADKMASSQNI